MLRPSSGNRARATGRDARRRERHDADRNGRAMHGAPHPARRSRQGRGELPRFAREPAVRVAPRGAKSGCRVDVHWTPRTAPTGTYRLAAQAATAFERTRRRDTSPSPTCRVSPGRCPPGRRTVQPRIRGRRVRPGPERLGVPPRGVPIEVAHRFASHAGATRAGGVGQSPRGDPMPARHPQRRGDRSAAREAPIIVAAGELVLPTSWGEHRRPGAVRSDGPMIHSPCCAARWRHGAHPSSRLHVDPRH